MIRKKVTLENGENVWAYYLDQEDRATFGTMQNQIAALKYERERLQDQIHVLARHLKDFRSGEIKEAILKQNLHDDKSFRRSDLWYGLPNELKAFDDSYDLFEIALDHLMNLAILEKRGSGWWRFEKEE